MKIPETVTRTLSVHIGTGSYNEGDIFIYDKDKETRVCSDFGTVFLTSYEVIIKLPQIDVTPVQIEALEAEKEKLQADCHMAVKEIDDKIQSLLAITYQEDAA